MSAKTLTSADVKAAFAAEGLKARVRDFKQNFRICDVDRKQHEAIVHRVAVSLGLTRVLGEPGGEWNGDTWFVGYKPGVIRRYVRKAN